MNLPTNRKRPTAPGHLIRYIAVHATGTRPDMAVTEMDKLPYHYVITRAGRLLNLNRVKPQDGTIEIAYIGGLNRHGEPADTRTPRQSETLFNTLVLLSELSPNATITGAGTLYGDPLNPGFDVKSWLVQYIPAFLAAA